MTLRRAGRILLLFAAALVIVALGVWLDFAKLFEADPDPVAAPRDSTEVHIQALARSNDFDAQMSYASPVVARNLLTGAVHSVVAPESTVMVGDVLFRVDDRPVVLLTGDTPAFRDMATDVVGTDVEQLEASLVGLGFDQGETVTVDTTFTANTAAMVARWQESTGQDATGTVDLGTVVFGESSMRVGATSSADAVVTLTSNQRNIVWEVPDEDIADLPGLVALRLPDRSSFETEVLTTEPNGDGQWLVSAAVPEGIDVPARDLVEVSVSWDVVETDELLTVPAAAVVRLDSGRHAIEVMRSGGSTEFVSIDVVASINGVVGFEAADIDAGTTVISP